MTMASPLMGRLGRLSGSSFVRAVATLSTGQLIAAALPLLAAPVLGRLYLPAEYGVLATYMAIASILGPISTLQLQNGIIAERSERRAEDIVRVCRWTAVPVAVGAALLAMALHQGTAGVDGYERGRGWLLLLPVSALLAAAVMPIAALANRRRRYADIAQIQVTVAIVTVAASISLGWLGWGVHGLLASYFLGQAMMLGLHLRLGGELMERQGRLSRRRAAAIVARHKGFALYTLPAEMVGNVNLQLPVLALSGLGAAATLGAYSRARQLIAAPLQLIGGSIAQVFRQRAAEQYHATGSCRRIFAQTFVMLAGAGLVPTLLLMALAPDIFRIVLGPNWTEAGELARVLAPMLYLGFVCSPLSTVFYIAGRQREDLVLSISALALLGGVIVPVLVTRSEPVVIVVGYSIAYAIVYIIYLVRSWKHACIPLPSTGRNGSESAGGAE